jgi:hypothetical protein
MAVVATFVSSEFEFNEIFLMFAMFNSENTRPKLENSIFRWLKNVMFETN